MSKASDFIEKVRAKARDRSERQNEKAALKLQKLRVERVRQEGKVRLKRNLHEEQSRIRKARQERFNSNSFVKGARGIGKRLSAPKVKAKAGRVMRFKPPNIRL